MGKDLNDWTKFTRRIYINAPMKQIYNCFSTRKEMETWFLKTSNYYTPDRKLKGESEQAEKGDTYLWEWHNWDSKEEGQVQDANGIDFFVFGFAEGSVSIKLTNNRNMILLTLCQYKIPTDDLNKMRYYVGCSNGWTFWMANLKAYLEHGILLHDMGPDIPIDEAGMEFVNV